MHFMTLRFFQGWTGLQYFIGFFWLYAFTHTHQVSWPVCMCVFFWCVCTEDAATHISCMSATSNSFTAFLQLPGDLNLLNHFFYYFLSFSHPSWYIFFFHNPRIIAVSPVIAMSPTVLNVIEDQQVTLPCVLLAGNPLPERQWLHNYGLVRTQRGNSQFSMSLFFHLT